MATSSWGRPVRAHPFRWGFLVIAATSIVAAPVWFGVDQWGPSASTPSTSQMTSAPGASCTTDYLTYSSAGQTAVISVSLGSHHVTYRATVPAHPDVGTAGAPMSGTIELDSAAASTTVVPLPTDAAAYLGHAIAGLCLVNSGFGLPFVMLTIFSGGAHCCFIPRIFQYRDPNKPAVLTFDANTSWGVLDMNLNEWLTPEVSGGRLILVGSDGQFPYEFAYYACSPAPIRLFSIGTDGRLTVVTSAHLGLVRRDAATLLAGVEYGSDGACAYGPLAAWAADECLLGRGPSAFAAIAHLVATRKIGQIDPEGPGRKPFVDSLRGFLQENGYHCA